jgi:hypothetical protein
MKVKDLINQLSNQDPEANIELMYSFYTLSADDKSVNVIQMEKDFIVTKDGSDSVLLATSQSLN